MINWSTAKPTEEGWYFTYYQSQGWELKIEILEVTQSSMGSLVIHEGTNGETYIEHTDGYTHWSRIELPEPPK